MKREPIGYIYMFTNRINGKKYIGQHEYKNGIDENYFGSGSIFAKAKEKYGIENFKFDILCWCNSKEELDNAESYFIGFKYYTYANTGRGYNIADGGNGGNLLRGKTEEEMREFKKKISEVWSNRTEEEMREIRKKMSENHADVSGEKNHFYGVHKYGEKNPMYGVHRYGENNPFYSKTHTDETKKKMSENHADFKGEKHPRARKVKCMETGEIFDCIKYACEWCGSHRSSIAKQIRGELKSTGKHPITGEKLHWEYVDEETIETNLNLSLISNISISLQ